MSSARDELERPLARRRLTIVAAVLAGLLLATWAAGPFLKTLTTEWYADNRPFLGIPNFLNVASNLAFLLVGVAGLVLCARAPRTTALPAWRVFYAGMVLTCFGSAWYHLAPSDAAIVWDRLGMIVAFVGLAAAVIAESTRTAIPALPLSVALLFGTASVLWWRQLAAASATVLLPWLSTRGERHRPR
jgi:hypothetical protein